MSDTTAATKIYIRGRSTRALPLAPTVAYSLGHRFYHKGKVWVRRFSPARALEIFQSQVDEDLARHVAIANMHVFGRLDIRSIGQLFVQEDELLHIGSNENQ
ncbi:hypothetical protein PG997_009451 [Apiospora hydei]|uniref:Uncharacterized protein n=1 Tax=Apiospora hydei TaxID=1337664 RepID=A0ABR1VU61_9PEZI